VSADEIDDRIAELRRIIADGEAIDGDVEECNALIDFRDDVERASGRQFSDATIVPESRFEAYASGYAESITNLDFIYSFVKWDEWARHVKSGYQQIKFGGDTICVRS
jgi:hypothetical protein